MEIKRDWYLQLLLDRRHNSLIKVITGIRRCGKSNLLFHLFKNYLFNQGIDESLIIEQPLDLRKNKQYRDPDVILEYIELLINDNEMYSTLILL